MDRYSSFADLEPLAYSMDAATSKESSSNYLTQQNKQFSCCASNLGKTVNEEFQSLLEDLEFTPTNSPAKLSQSLSAEQEFTDDEEDTDVKFPYQRRNGYEGLAERLRKRLEDGSLESSIEIDATVQRTKERIQNEKNEKRIGKEINLMKYANESVYICIICSKVFNSPDELIEHTEKKHDYSKNSFGCHRCGAKFKYKKNLDSHLKKHMENSGHECKECFIVFRCRETLENHIFKRHNNTFGMELEKDKLVICPICSQSVLEGTIKRHMYYCKNKENISKKRAEQKTRSVPPSPACSAVSCESFTSLQASSSSPRASIVDKSCVLCGQSFASRQSMLRHIGRKHPERKNDPSVTSTRYIAIASPIQQYACTECGKRVTTRAALNLHIERIHRNNAKYECEICHKSYPIPSELRKHIGRVHKKKNESVIEEESLFNLQF